MCEKFASIYKHLCCRDSCADSFFFSLSPKTTAAAALSIYLRSLAISAGLYNVYKPLAARANEESAAAAAREAHPSAFYATLIALFSFSRDEKQVTNRERKFDSAAEVHLRAPVCVYLLVEGRLYMYI